MFFVRRCRAGVGDRFFTALVPSVVASLGTTFPELAAQQERVQAVIAEEEEAFSSMLSRGIKEFNARAGALQKQGASELSGEAAFFLYDSMGFPLDLTELMAKEAGLTVDASGFEAAMAAQKARSAAAAKAAKGGGAGLALGAEQTAWLAEQGVAFTDDDAKFATDVNPTVTLRAIYVGGDGAFADAATPESGSIGLVLDATAFYAEAGGQVADVGTLLSIEGGATFEVSNVQSFGGYLLHMGELTSGELATDSQLTCHVDYARRLDIAKSHTVTHVLNYALQQVLGEGVAQKGSLADDEKVRFDFSHPKAMSLKQIEQVEGLVRQAATSTLPVHAAVVPLDKAMEINGLRAVFGERYPDPVRVVSIGPSIDELLADPASERWSDYSIELCGGTHLPSTEVLSSFALTEETAVAKGVRRVVGVTGEAAATAIASGDALSARLDELRATDAASLADKAAIDELRKGLSGLKGDIDKATIPAFVKATLRDALGARDKELTKAAKKLAQAETDKAAAAATETAAEAAAAGARYVVLRLDGAMDAKAMQPLVQKVLKQTSLAVLALSVDDFAGKVSCFAAVPEAEAEALPANNWLQARWLNAPLPHTHAPPRARGPLPHPRATRVTTLIGCRRRRVVSRWYSKKSMAAAEAKRSRHRAVAPQWMAWPRRSRLRASLQAARSPDEHATVHELGGSSAVLAQEIVAHTLACEDANAGT